MFVNYLKRVIAGEYLTSSEAYEVIDLLLTEQVPENQAAAFFAALRVRRETGDELYGFARALLEKAIKFDEMDNLLDTCGTGGDGLRTFNISTAAAIICSACGVKVAKHGNRAVTSQTGSADVLEALGVSVSMDIKDAQRALEEIGFAFLFAPNFHPAMKHFGSMRRSLGIATAFNFLGPLINPFCPSYQIMGVSDPAMMEPVATALYKLGRKRALVVHAKNGMDEISPVGTTTIIRLDENEIRHEQFDPYEMFPSSSLEGIRGGNAIENARTLKNVMAGQPGPARDAVILNAGAALEITGNANNLTDGIAMAAEAIDSGCAAEKLLQMIIFSQESQVKEC
jgi:anthranilate phosphoribosyltransferase